ncbi:MAG: tRNA (N(6)-L-threonylcarbamoyladenosine(37)-C(2))-methylthiotransferase MtaB [Gammaproteobacteria bacterium]|nr:MAG: tRNA (N(6)-L-threonylcarbamoyladenosine(37)-C(2))-methylthiotransferase MtaB [Gammaproteobacteria bacterium]
MKSVAFCTFGCRLNQYDTETIRTLLDEYGGWRRVPFREQADVYVVNTCSVTARADATCRKAIRRIHAERPGSAIVVTGCYAQRAPRELAELPGVRLIVGAADRGDIANKMRRMPEGDVEIAVSPIADADEFVDVPITEMMEHSRAFVKVQEGCNESCSFCIVPQTRGRSRSRRPESVLEQVHALSARGYVEVVLTGVHLGDYGLDLPGNRHMLTDLVREILEVPELQRFRLSSIEPASITDELIELMAGHDKFARHFHIPLQSASDAVLSRMKRRYTAEHFSNLIQKISRAIPDCGIGADVICGFPGETDEHFRQTFDCLAELPITYVHAFTYSVRPGSEAQSYGDQIPGDVKKRRIRALKRLMRDKQRAFRVRHVGKTLPVLLESSRRNGRAYLAGWTDNYLRVELGEGEAEGGVVDVHIVAAEGDRLRGEWVPAG